MTDHFLNIYHNRAGDYERLIACEDYQGNILAKIREVALIDGADVVEFGAGTGRLTRFLGPHVNHIHAFDFAPAMLGVAQRILKDLPNWTLAVGDNRQMPVASKSADIVIEGWSFGHVMGWVGDEWRPVLDRMLGEMGRILRPDGTTILMETLGTGSEEPIAPHEGLALLYKTFEVELGFTRHVIRTDYQFESLEEAVELAGFFFGNDMAERVRDNNWIILPECTGLWVRS
ncbi:MAG: class I SAM-dependent methyltransferase [Chloroflexi bacterium]|nr:class I SAM-dependent methyltransferase [Chloroflexota bacterium]